MDLLLKLYSNTVGKDKENNPDANQGRKKNFLERNRFVNYEMPPESDEKKKESPHKKADDDWNFDFDDDKNKKQES